MSCRAHGYESAPWRTGESEAVGRLCAWHPPCRGARNGRLHGSPTKGLPMIQPKDQTVRASSPLRGPWLPLSAMAVITAFGLVSACDDDDATDIASGSGGSSNGGSGGGAGTAGSGGGAGSDASAGAGGSAGSAGSAGTGGSAGAAGSSGVVLKPATGTVTQLSDVPALLGPTTAAFRGTSVFVVNGQLDQRGGSPVLPFTVVGFPLAGGAINATIDLPDENFFPEGIAADADGT